MSARRRSWPVPVALGALGAIPLPPVWHRRAGRVVVVTGMLVAISALWMTLFYAPQPGTGDLLYVLRLVFGSAMAACLVLGVTAVRRGDIPSHRMWMVRAYAIGVAADLAEGAGWAINLAVAEWALRRPAGRRLDLPSTPEHAGALS